MEALEGTKSETTFQEEFRSLTRHIEFFKECYEKSKNIIKQVENVFINDMDAKNPYEVFVSSEESCQLEEFINKRASVLVVGQTNSGKSSLINELLGSSYLPTSEVPCTSRIVRIRHSEKNFLRVKDMQGKVVNQETPFKKSIPKAEIAFEDTSKRGDKVWASSIVEVGLNNPLLQGGHLEFVDAPGMSENDVLDSIVNECAHGILQILIYVIDGNSSLRTQDREFLFNLKPKIGGIPIFFVCNKVDFNEKAAEFDRDDNEDESYLDPENQLKIISQKKERIFSALVRSSLIDKERYNAENCDFFHAVSTKEIKRARRKGKEDILQVHTKAFEKMKRCLLDFATKSIVRHVSIVAENLANIQQRIFDFYISRQFIGMKMDEVFSAIQKVRNSETRCFEKMRQYVIENSEKIEKILDDAISRKEEDILKEVEEMEFAPIAIADVVHRNEIINQYKGQIQKMVLIATLNVSLKAVTHTVRVVSQNVNEQLRRTLIEASKRGGLAGRLVKQQMRHVDMLSSIYHSTVSDMINMAAVKDYSLMNLTYRTLDPPKSFILDVVSVFKGTHVDKAWKRKIAKNILDNVDRSKLRDRIIGALLDNLHSSHECFEINLGCIQILCQKAHEQTEQQEIAVSEYGPDFAWVMCLNDALLNSLQHTGLQLGEQMGRRGNRGIVYTCTSSSGRFTKMKLVAKQFHESTSNLVSFSIQLALKRLEENHPNVLTPVALVLIDNRMTLLLPRQHVDLYSILNNNEFQTTPFLSRLRILKQMQGACKFCRGNGLQFIDPRITNVMLDENNQAFLNVCKPRDDNVCYPDGLVPFHVFTEPPPLIYTSQKVLQITTTHDVYALGIMGWLLALGIYERPAYARTSNVEEVYAAASINTGPDFSSLSSETDDCGLVGLIIDCLQDKCSLWELEEELNKIMRYLRKDEFLKETYI